jgi:hypothetical protein
MIKGKQTWTVGNILKMHQEKKVLTFDHPIQRHAGLWTIGQRSLLIHSMLSGYPIPNLYILRGDSEILDDKGKPVYNFSVLDGKQRLTNVLSFINGDYALTDDIPDVTIDDERFSISGKWFIDLEEPLRNEILRYKFDIITFENCDNEEIETIFFRLNNATPLSKSQIAKAKAGTEIAIILNELLNGKFFAESCNFSLAQRRTSDDQRSLLQGTMLLSSKYVSGFELVDFSEKSIMEYAESIKGNFTEKQENILKSAIQYLTDAFQAPNKQLRKISIPMLVYLADYAMERIRPMHFRQWFEYFTEEDPLFEDYKKFCSSGSTKLEKLNGRLAVMAKSFARYSETEIPEELIEKVKALEKEDVEKEDTEVENKESLEVKLVDNLELEPESKEAMEYDDMEMESGEESKVAEESEENLDSESMKNDEVEIQ